MPLIAPYGFLRKGGPKYASLLFQSSQNSTMTRVNSGSITGNTRFTFSVWARITNRTGNGTELIFRESGADSISCDVYTLSSSDHGALMWNSIGTDWIEDVEGLSGSPDQWFHWVFRFDGSNGTAANRARIYKNGAVQSPTTQVNPGSGRTHDFFESGATLRLGGSSSAGINLASIKLAFIDMIDGQSLDPTDFGVNDGGTWKRKKYTGSYGIQGFSLDGTGATPGTDVSGTGKNFTSVTGVTLDNELPPFVS